MRIRTGFVANSSSSSFILRIPREEFDELVETIAETIDYELNEYKKASINYMEDMIDKYNRYDEKDKENKKYLYYIYKMTDIEEYTKKLEELKKAEKPIDILRYILKHDVEIQKGEHFVKVKYWINMFNNYHTSLPFYLLEMILTAVALNIPIKIENEPDGY